MNNQKEWLEILTRLYKKLHLTDEVIHHSQIQDKKKQKILSYLNKLEDIHNKVSMRKDKGLEQLLKSFYYEKYIIKEENIPENYYLNQQRILRERGYGNVPLTEEIKHQLALQIIEDQKTSLNCWIDYLLYDEESKSYAIWEKYWLFQGIMALGQYDLKTGKFHKRDQSTVCPFPDVNREAIFTTLYLMEEFLKTKTAPEVLKNSLNNANFKTIYEYTIKEIQTRNYQQNKVTEGIWKKYNQGSDYHKLRNSLQGYHTGWCTAYGENFAKDQLAGGDFYVYYTKDKNKEYKIPRIAIRMDGHYSIGEIRGIALNQNLEPEMIPILNKKLEEFPDRDKYYKKEQNMALLTKIEYKNKEKQPLTKEELRFLYEMDNTIEGFGQAKDPRIYEIKNSRNLKKDLSKIFNIPDKDISLTSEEALSGKYKFHYGDLTLCGITRMSELILPEVIHGDLDLSGLTIITNFTLPKEVHGDLHLEYLIRAKNLVLPEIIHGDLHLTSLRNVEGLIFPKVIHGSLYLNSLTKAEGLTLPEIIHKSLYLENLISAKGLIFPKIVHEHLSLHNLMNTENLILPEEVHCGMDVSNLTNIKNLILPKFVQTLYLDNLQSADRCIMPYSLKNKISCKRQVYNEITFVPDDEYYSGIEKSRAKKLSLRY